VVIHLHDRRFVAADLITKLQHASAGFPLLFVGLHNLAEEAERPLAFLEITIAVLVLSTFAREVWAARKHHHGAHSSIGWFDLAAAGMMMFEAFHGHHSGKPGYLRPQFFSAMVTLALALFHGRFHSWRANRRYVKLDEKGLEARSSRFRRFSLVWSELDRIHIARQKAVFHRSDGRRHTLRLQFLANHDEVRKHLVDHARAAGVSLNTIS
jgi:hypothetical protein